MADQVINTFMEVLETCWIPVFTVFAIVAIIGFIFALVVSIKVLIKVHQYLKETEELFPGQKGGKK